MGVTQIRENKKCKHRNTQYYKIKRQNESINQSFNEVNEIHVGVQFSIIKGYYGYYYTACAHWNSIGQFGICLLFTVLVVSLYLANRQIQDCPV